MSKLRTSPTPKEKIKVLESLRDFLDKHDLEIHNLWDDTDFHGEPQEPELTTGFAISANGFLLTTVLAETVLSKCDIEEAIEDIEVDYE